MTGSGRRGGRAATDGAASDQFRHVTQFRLRSRNSRITRAQAQITHIPGDIFTWSHSLAADPTDRLDNANQLVGS